MGKCILRVAKITSQGSATGKTSHNYRQVEVPNADPKRGHLNEEYLNEGEKNIWTLANERIQEMGIKGVRKDAVRGMEFLITASPDTFERDSNGVMKGDYRDSGWLQDNFMFLGEKYGENLVAFTLHQDEKTPHIHAIVVPITADGRLSAKELFNPISLKKLQTEYAQAMSKYGLERGIEGSRARHQTMKQIYGAQQQTQQGIESDLQPLQATQQPLTIDKPGTLDLLNLERWKQQQEAKINAEYNHKLAEAREAAQKAQNIATANATAAEQVKVLQQRLNTAESLKQTHFEKVQLLEKALMKVDEHRIDKTWLRQQVDQVRARSVPQMEKDLLECIKGFSNAYELAQRLSNKGYKLTPMPTVRYIEDPKTEVRLDLDTHKIKGQSFAELVKADLDRSHQADLARIRKKKKNRKPPSSSPWPPPSRKRTKATVEVFNVHQGWAMPKKILGVWGQSPHSLKN